MICWHDGHLLLTGEVCRMFTTLKRAGELETFVGLKYRPPWMGPESKMVFSCNMRFLVPATAGTLQANINITKPKPVRVLHAAPIALLRHEKTSTGHDRVSSSTPHQELQLSYTKLISKLLCLLMFTKRLDWTLLLTVDTTKLDHCTSLPHSNQGANNDHVSGGRPWTTNKVTGSGNFHCQDRLRRLKGITWYNYRF